MYMTGPCPHFLQAELYHPLSDVSAVQTFVDSLAQELKRRMQDAEVAGGVEVWHTLQLTQLLHRHSVI